jgi:dihydroorotate dehydrogenase
MLNALIDLARPALLVLDPERAHELTLRSLEKGLHPRDGRDDPPCLAARLGTLELANPVGIAAGFDKDARVPDAVLAMGCGFAEIGTVTPLPQEGNPKPRVFRLITERAVINRNGFNNCGHADALARLQARLLVGSRSASGNARRLVGSRSATRESIVGVNIGANKDSADRAGDYVKGLETFYDVASYFTVNISSPNTPGLRDLQAPAALDELLGRVMAARSARVAAGAPQRPVIVKVSPDIAEADVQPIADRLMAHHVDAIAVSNTTLARPGVEGNATAKEAGGLSGRPLFHRSTVMLARFHVATGGRVPLVGLGGIDSGETAIAKLEAGASLLQLYTALVYEGPGLIRRIKDGIAERCTREGLASYTALTGRRAAEWAGKRLEG